MNADTEYVDFLLQGKNTDGGWGYAPGKASRLEPTCWAALAIDETPSARAALANWPAADGLLLERAGGSPNYAFHGLALLTMHHRKIEHVAGYASLLAAIQVVRGVKLPPSTINTEDTSLQAWSWIADTFSWVEPTAWCLLALKVSKRSGKAVDQSRIDVAERMLVDRCCRDGGWNYGNSNMLGQQLKPFVPTTAIALLSLQDRRDLPEVQKSITYLEREATNERSSSALALAAIALRTFGLPVAPVTELLKAQLGTTLAFRKHAALAMALYALNGGDNDAPFRI